VLARVASECMFQECRAIGGSLRNKGRSYQDARAFDFSGGTGMRTGRGADYSAVTVGSLVG